MLFPPQTTFDGVQDVIVMVLDDISDRDLDGIQTPVLDSLAQSGLRFRRAYSQPVCSASRRSMMFGQWHLESTQASCVGTEDLTGIRPNLPSMMAQQGYATAAFGKWHLGTATPWETVAQQMGFDEWLCGTPGNLTQCGGTGYNDWVRVDNGIITQSSEYQTEALRDAFINWWFTTPGRKFAWVSFSAPHAPIHQPPAHMLPPGYPRSANPRLQWEAMVVSADKAIGDMLSVVRLEQTIVIVVADNGTPQAVSVPPSKGTTAEAGVRVPMIWKVPGMRATAGETASLWHVADLIRSLQVLLGLAPDQRLGREWVYVGRDGTQNAAAAKRRWGSVVDRAIIEPRWKLREVDGVHTFYDLEADPDELSPLPLQGEDYLRLKGLLQSVS